MSVLPVSAEAGTAEAGIVDEVILPEESRDRLVAALQVLRLKER
ncbi:MAG: hypothetical protein ACRDRL_08425 [Sciscionella sp.]